MRTKILNFIFSRLKSGDHRTIQILGIKIKYTKNRYRKFTKKMLLEYIKYINYTNMHPSVKFIPLSAHKHMVKTGEPRLIAFYLPQFHSFSSNDLWYGKGFTEWTNVTRAIPQFTGHYQPHIPYDVGFYNLDTSSIMHRQVELARTYGIHGFAFYYYWFSGQRLMEKPLFNFLKDSALKFPFCITWACENWTKLWDGGNREILYESKLRDGDDIKFFHDVLPIFMDERYIQIQGKRLFLLYRPTIFGEEKCRAFLSSLRSQSHKHGFDLYCVMALTRELLDIPAKDLYPSRWGCDAFMEFPPHGMVNASKERTIQKLNTLGYKNPYFQGTIFDIFPYIKNKKYHSSPRNYPHFKTVFPSWDNSPRKAYSNAEIYMNTSPNLYQEWLFDCLVHAKKFSHSEENFVFINAWNEWAEGAHLEPDLKYGYAYLQATKDALELASNNISYDIPSVYINCIEHLGDIVACEPLSRYARHHYPGYPIYWIVRSCYREIVAYNPFIDEIILVSCLSDTDEICQLARKYSHNIVLDVHFNKRRCSKTGKTHSNPTCPPEITADNYYQFGGILEVFSCIAGLEKLDEAPIFHLDPGVNIPYILPKRYVVFHCLSNETSRNWRADLWNRLAQDIIDRGIGVVEIGLTPVVHNKNSLFFDLTSEHSLQCLALIIKNAYCFIGIDSSFAHIANCLNTYSILLFGKYRNFIYRMPYTGNFAQSQHCTLLYANQYPVEFMPYEVVINAFINFMDNKKEFLNQIVHVPITNSPYQSYPVK